eukprot:1073200-Ditylum_brightwellii.AAC.1
MGIRHICLTPNNSDLHPVGLLTEQAFIGHDNFMLGIVATSLEAHQNWYYSYIGRQEKNIEGIIIQNRWYHLLEWQKLP